MQRIIFVLTIALLFLSCTRRGSVQLGEHFSLINTAEVQNNYYVERLYENDLYTVKERAVLPEYVGNIYQLKANPGGIYFNDRQSVFRYAGGEFSTVFTPSKGYGPNEVEQVFRFDIRIDDVIAIAGYPDMRLLLHQVSTDTSALIITQFRGNVLIDKNFDIYGENSGHNSSFMITKFDASGDSLMSFGRLFQNQGMSLNMFDFYWDYNEKHDLIIVGYMYAGYYAAFNTDGSIAYIVESIQHPGIMPMMVNRGGMEYIETEGRTVMSGLTTRNDEIHIYTANAMNRRGEVYGALVDVLDVKTGVYKFSYVLEERLHWPVQLLDDYSIASVTEDYELVIWKRETP